MATEALLFEAPAPIHGGFDLFSPGPHSSYNYSNREMDPLGYPISATTTHHVSAAEEFNWSRGVPVSDAGHGIGVSGVASTTMNTMPAVTDFLSGARYVSFLLLFFTIKFC